MSPSRGLASPLCLKNDMKVGGRGESVVLSTGIKIKSKRMIGALG